ncbi:putative tetratricopeptide-like helical domain superfamily [Helianthus debilis subsp. tardiflorus]
MLQLGKSTHGYFLRNMLGPNSRIANGLVDMYRKCGSLKEARKVFDETPERNLTSWNSMINYFTLHGQSETVIAVWGSLLNSCKIYGRMDLAEIAVKKLIELEPNNGGYGAMLANIYDKHMI